MGINCGVWVFFGGIDVRTCEMNTFHPLKGWNFFEPASPSHTYLKKNLTTKHTPPGLPISYNHCSSVPVALYKNCNFVTHIKTKKRI
ncbi:MAG: hypothetical protein C0593_04375 [Marinilabiliales bacterium]|nr:MAG: hypothetical protein C0593_04375 [Marinilabiliales bacterium]